MTTTLPTAEQVCGQLNCLFTGNPANSEQASGQTACVCVICQAADFITAQTAEIERLTKERDVAVGERIARSKLMQRLRDTLVDILEGIEDEGDRIYFGSSNDADELRDGFRTLEDWNWHDILRDEKLIDPFETSRNAIARAEAAEASLAAVKAERDQDKKRLDWLEAHPEMEISYSGWEEEPLWQVHAVLGGRNDREWHLRGASESVRAALDAALSLDAQGEKE